MPSVLEHQGIYLPEFFPGKGVCEFLTVGLDPVLHLALNPGTLPVEYDCEYTCKHKQGCGCDEYVRHPVSPADHFLERPDVSRTQGWIQARASADYSAVRCPSEHELHDLPDGVDVGHCA